MKKKDNRERKFVAVRNDVSTKLLGDCNLLTTVNITQFYGDFKYRKLSYDDGRVEYTKSYKEGSNTFITDITEHDYNIALSIYDTENTIKKLRKVYSNGDFKICIDTFIEPVSFEMIEVENGLLDISEFIPNKCLIEVTDNPIYSNENIKSGSIISKGIIDGGDLAGKSTVIKELIAKGLICLDRSVDHICPFMFDHVTEENRIQGLRKVITTTLKDNLIIFFVNTDRNEINRRLHHRKNIEGLSEFDQSAYHYNLMYSRAGEVLKDITNFRLIYGNNKSVNEVTAEIETLIRNGADDK